MPYYTLCYLVSSIVTECSWIRSTAALKPSSKRSKWILRDTWARLRDVSVTIAKVSAILQCCFGQSIVFFTSVSDLLHPSSIVIFTWSHTSLLLTASLTIIYMSWKNNSKINERNLGLQVRWRLRIPKPRTFDHSFGELSLFDRLIRLLSFIMSIRVNC